MKKIIQKLSPYIKPFKKNIFWNIIFNILYAFFGTLSFVALIPLMNVLFDNTKKVYTEPIWTGVANIQDYAENLLYFKVTSLTESGNPQFALLLVVSLVIVTFLLKNLSGYLASHHMMHLRNGVMASLRNVMFKKVISLPVSFYSEKRKEMLWQECLEILGKYKTLSLCYWL